MTASKQDDDRLREILAAHQPSECVAECQDPSCPHVHAETFGDFTRDEYLMAAELLELRSKREVEGERVKALIWPKPVSPGSRITSGGGLLMYTIRQLPEGCRWYRTEEGPMSEPMDLDAAKAAAQADYEQRIRSALVPSPQEGGQPLRGEDAWQPIETAPHACHVIAARWVEAEWVYDIKMSPPSKRLWTHWQLLPAPPHPATQSPENEE
jgi:hypothetical protein